MSTPTKTDRVRVARAGSIRKASGGADGLPSMDEPGVAAFIGDALRNPAGSRLAAGFFELHAGRPLVYHYEYDEMKLVVSGTFTLTETETGHSLQAGPGEVLFFAQGTTVTFETDDRAVGFYVGDRSFAP